MLKGTLIVMAFVAIWGGVSVDRGCKDARRSLSTLAYYDHRDMRTSVGFTPQKVYVAAPDTLSVPTSGRERWNAGDVLGERARYEATFKNPQSADDSSVARGERKFMKTCIPCHGVSMKGDGPVAAKFIPPPDLLGSTTRARSDGYIYSYIRHGGAIMPSYGAQVTAQEANDLINYIRHQQQVSPR
jgi:mono/diheme cytochrome c family protein